MSQNAGPAASARLSRRIAAALATHAAPPPPSFFQRRRMLLWLSLGVLALVAIPVTCTAQIFLRGQASAARIAMLTQGSAWEQEQTEAALLADWETVGPAVNEAAYSTKTEPALKARCIEMMLMNHPDERIATLTKNLRMIRISLGSGDFLTQERAEDQILAGWGQMERAVAACARDKTLPDCVRLRCHEMIELKSPVLAAQALAQYSRGSRCYRAARHAQNPASLGDEEAAWILDDVNQYQTPDPGTPLGAPEQEAYERARDCLSSAQDLYQTLADSTSGNQKLSAEERARRASRLYLACIKFMPLDLYEKDKARKKREEQERQKKAREAPSSTPE